MAHPDWQEAWRAALYGPLGFFARGSRPADHFRTSPLVGPELAEAVVELLDRVDVALDRPNPLDFVDVGAGGGELAAQVFALGKRFRGRLRVRAVELVRPSLPAGVEWSRELPDQVTGLVIAHEWLDSLPCQVVQMHENRVREVHVSPDGTESLGSVVSSQWLDAWWPLSVEGQRAEIGATRDAAWADLVARVAAGAALAVDYGHFAAARPFAGTLTGYRAGRQVTPVPDGSCDITAHVAWDAVAAATGPCELLTQREALAALGIANAPPAAGLAAQDPLGWLAGAGRASRVAELRDPAGLGGFHWLLCPRSAPIRLVRA
ncbi:SAM-dependent methyltransferase [Kutzneria sp. CA-103260]|uniref:SAM-dependent methyltransferase n=1 Tax=Kutzneria sp. CA-103260 TaxID=2802641 RepID=UPI001BAD69FD|nr:SAM-dependent methyltransferase [Kutzneria sp. CA-103260]QUQ69665.1 Putative S-adenosyl-L-methionine-dependent methyltransferase [Kutzneria sp. CA-103260]